MENTEQKDTAVPAGEARGRRRFRPLHTLRLVLLAAALCAAAGVGCYLAGRAAGAAQQIQKPDAVVVENQLTQISELASVSWSYTNMAQFESSNEFYGMAVPFTTKKFILSYDGKIKAGVDLSRAEVSVSGTEVTVRLPEAEILSHEIDEDSVEIFDEKTSIFNPFTVEDFTAFQADQKAAMEEKALAKGLLTEGLQQARASVRALVEPSLPEGWTLRME
ncbi:DUF4230 domain-containing protein [uncultured Oscillibacter sp.]|uniref:DUF4230 domain-containing protein n=1 Tax=uncultured Oscillibacter sp. TaxID=876091 RepID=UPI0025FA6BC4|nr:DUF4230 domain-containing protein [uncultured Oscillibacter sp.]